MIITKKRGVFRVYASTNVKVHEEEEDQALMSMRKGPESHEL